MRGPSQYGGIAAVFVFGVGLLLVGKTWAGVGVLGAGALTLGIALAPTASGRALVAAIGALLCSTVLGYQAASNEFTGKATYHHGLGRGSWAEPVTREDSPSKFREATNLIWGFSLLSALVSAGTFIFYRKSDAAEDF